MKAWPAPQNLTCCTCVPPEVQELPQTKPLIQPLALLFLVHLSFKGAGILNISFLSRNVSSVVPVKSKTPKQTQKLCLLAGVQCGWR